MNRYPTTSAARNEIRRRGTSISCKTRFLGNLHRVAWLLALPVMSRGAIAQVNVLTAHNDIARTGQNLNETILTPSTVSISTFGKLFSHTGINGIGGQPLYVSHVGIPINGTTNVVYHNVVYVGSGGDVVYAFDADDNGGINANPLWKVSLLTNSTPSGTYSSGAVGGTPVIDPPSSTMYLLSIETTKTSPAVNVFRLHALDITTGAEKFGGPVQIQASVAGTGAGSSGGTLTFDTEYELQRPGLLLLNGVVYIAFGSTGDVGTWHGWLFSYDATTLHPIDAFCTTANGVGAGIWMGGAGLAAEVNNPAKPYGRMFVATGNGTYSASKPYSRSMSYGMSVLDLDLTGGIMTVEDEFTPFNQAILDAQDGDLGSGGVVLLPRQTLASGTTLNPLVQVGKSGMIYILDRDNLGGYNSATDQVPQEVQTPIIPDASGKLWGAGIWGSPGYWNQNLYFGGTRVSALESVTAYSLINGVLSGKPTNQTDLEYSYPGPTSSISANGATNGIVWVINSREVNIGDEILLAYDASNLNNLLYSSNARLPEDDPGGAILYAVPTVVNGKVYVGATEGLSVYGLLGSVPTVDPPVISPPGATFTGSQTVTITDATPGAAIYYTTNGSTPTVSSTLYNSSSGISVTANETITAIASATGYLQGAPVSAVFSSTANAANPVILLAGGTYSGTQSVGITDATISAQIYYTVDGSTPTSASNPYTQPIAVPVSETVQAIAIAPSLLPSSIVSAAYDIDPAYTINFSQGFAQSQSSGQIQFNGSTTLDDFRLQLTNGGFFQAGSAFYTTPVPISAFTTDFTFQLSNPVADGITFTIQGVGPTALGGNSKNLGYGGINNSVAIKFDINNNTHEGNDSTGMYLNGATPTVPAIDLTNTGINLHSGDYMNVHMTYDGQNLNMTITDAITLAVWSNSWIVNIPAQIGASTGYVGFTGSTGGATASQKLTSWTYLAGIPPVPNYPAGFDPVNGSNILALNGNSALSGTGVQLTSGALNQASSAYYAIPVAITAFTTDFDFTISPGSTSTLGGGLTFVIQNAGPTALGPNGAGLGYATIPNSVAIKFDVFNSAGEGNDSTGAYIKGATPTVPAMNLNGGIGLGTGHRIHLHITYDGTTLTWSMRDLNATLTPIVVSDSKTINIPNTIGSNLAYVGFTGSSGPQETSIEKVLDWTFSNP
jgi:hypothetical protein